MIIEVTGIVLKQQDYKEKDVLLSIATKEYGRMTLLAKSLRSIASKNAGACMPLMLSKFTIDYHELKSIHVLTGSEVVNSFRVVREDLYKQAFASAMCECCYYLLEAQQEENAFDELKIAFEVLQASKTPLLCFGLYLAHVCHEFGIDPFVDGCVACGSESGICCVSIQDGGFICVECYEISMVKQSREFLRLFRLLMKANYEHLSKIESTDGISGEVVLFLLHFIQEHTSCVIKSEKYIRDILHI